MARLVDKPQRVEDQQNDLEILHPERPLIVAGEHIRVREYGFVEGLRLRPLMGPFLDDLHAVLATGDDLTLEAVRDIIATHLDQILDLICKAADIERDFIDALDDEAGQLLLMAWWSANSRFFLRALQTRLLTEAMRQRHQSQASAAAGATSTPPSSPPGMTPAGSETTPSAN